jgi:sialate O-acetylesterase
MSAGALQEFPEFDEDVNGLAHANDATAKRNAEYERRKAEWYMQHRNHDRGYQNGAPRWADRDYDTANWPTISLPLRDSCDVFNGFAGVVWFRRQFVVPPDLAAEGGALHLGNVVNESDAYVNGIKLERSAREIHNRIYSVPTNILRAGENSIAVRVMGFNKPPLSCVGIVTASEDIRPVLNLGERLIPLAGVWSFQPGPSLDDFPLIDAEARRSKVTSRRATALFNGMIHPLRRYKIKGVIWYQGEANVFQATQYRRLFPALINDWRLQWGYTLPFLFVQLPGFGWERSEPSEYAWADFRDAQSAALELPLTSMAVTIDIGDEEDIHPRNKREVARRLALAAARLSYGENVVSSGPVFNSMKKEVGRIRITFSSAGSGLTVKDKYGYVRGFQISDAKGVFYWAKAQLDGSDIVVFNEAISDPMDVRYAWGNSPDGNLYNKEGLPAAPFRTDAQRTLVFSQ